MHDYDLGVPNFTMSCLCTNGDHDVHPYVWDRVHPFSEAMHPANELLKLQSIAYWKKLIRMLETSGSWRVGGNAVGSWCNCKVLSKEMSNWIFPSKDLHALDTYMYLISCLATTHISLKIIFGKWYQGNCWIFIQIHFLGYSSVERNVVFPKYKSLLRTKILAHMPFF